MRKRKEKNTDPTRTTFSPDRSWRDEVPQRAPD